MPADNATDNNGTQDEPITAEAIAETIVEFEQYRERLLNETLTAAKKAKMSKKATMAKLEPELEKIDAVIQNLRVQHAAMAGTEAPAES
ncbi:MAG: hypothetical protein F6K30_09250 [Cyanothece sp. SIO2G6]|nr:hypothetical protein [Cyanothece sp. SIO2G6]